MLLASLLIPAYLRYILHELVINMHCPFKMNKTISLALTDMQDVTMMNVLKDQ